MNYTYILLCADNTFYIGWTTDLDNRLEAHNDGKGAKYTRGRTPVKLVYWEEHKNRSEAQKREVALRRFNKKQKLNLIEGFQESLEKEQSINYKIK
ncbi:putative endonuclease [Natronincola peptidivorans]|uniref:Putative endonuclease n=1 Tax=Natronincola peptidivorans TaxID=426128 RepID=A0A1I0GGF2_9FIRM|nr:GIY-YIG nuclease family protein [Natronincola peptidivorans]SET70219.1 putative endonuclease [Natronincola peptidivorans]